MILSLKFNEKKIERFTHIDEKKKMADNLQIYLLCMLFSCLSGGSDDLSRKEVKNTIFIKFFVRKH